jgi:hypothetical protein
MDFATFRTDTALEDEGAWVALDDQTRVKVARIGNRKYREAFQRRIRPYAKALKAGALSDKIAEQIMTDTLAETVLLGWQGFTRDGAELAYSAEAARAMLADPAYKDFRDLVVEIAGEMATFKRRADEDAEKNSATSSAGS